MADSINGGIPYGGPTHWVDRNQNGLSFPFWVGWIVGWRLGKQSRGRKAARPQLMRIARKLVEPLSEAEQSAILEGTFPVTWTAEFLDGKWRNIGDEVNVAQPQPQLDAGMDSSFLFLFVVFIFVWGLLRSVSLVVAWLGFRVVGSLWSMAFRVWLGFCGRPAPFTNSH